MSNLWDLSHIQPETRVVLDGETIPAMFWNGVSKRGPQVWMRQKKLGIWRSATACSRRCPAWASALCC